LSCDSYYLSDSEASADEADNGGFTDFGASSVWDLDYPLDWIGDNDDNMNNNNIGKGTNANNTIDNDGDSDDANNEHDKGKNELDFVLDSSQFTEILDTDWCNPNITSWVLVGKTQIMTKLCIQCIEYLTEIPSVWPIPRVLTTFILDLHDPKYGIADTPGKLYQPDALIKNKVRQYF
jgi:hypothetical protein